MRTKLVPKDIIDKSKRIVIKVGTESITKDGKVDFEWLNAFAEDIAILKSKGKEVFVVTSGAIALGRGLLNIDPTIPTKNLPVRIQQKLATAGQIDLMAAYSQAFAKAGLRPQQVLLTADVVENQKQIQNLRNTCLTDPSDDAYFQSLVPVMNEDDALATEEITFGDNDGLGAIVTRLLNADLYILFSKLTGLFTDNPAKNPNARHIPYITDEVEANRYVNDDINGISRGGMKTKVMACFNAVANGAIAILAQAQNVPHCLFKLMTGEPDYKSTVFSSAQQVHIAQVEPQKFDLCG
jgi:glutamate 5-kinase